MKKIFFPILFLLIFTINQFPAFAEPLIKISPEIIELSSVGETFTASVLLENAADLAAFDFQLYYDPDIVTVASKDYVVLSESLKNQNRNFSPAEPLIDNIAGRIRFSAFSYGDEPGPDGSIALADISFTIQSLTSGILEPQNTFITDSKGERYNVQAVNNGEIGIIHIITATAETNGRIEPSGELKIIQGKDQEFIITPNIGYNISDIMVNSVSAGTASPYTFTNITENHTISALFAINIYNVTFESSPCGSITGETQQTIQYNQNCSTVTAQPQKGYEFTGWTGDYSGTENPLTLTGIDKNMTVRAGFKTGNMTLFHAITGLQILSGIEIENKTNIPDINKDSRTGIEEVIYILQIISNIRENISCN